MAEYPKWPEMPDEQKFEYLRECAENLSRTVQRIEENQQLFHERLRKVETSVVQMQSSRNGA